ARAFVASSRTVRACAAKLFTVSTRFGTRSARRWYTFCTCAHFSLTLWSATTSWLLTETAQARVPPTARTTTTRAIRRPRAIAGFDYILGARRDAGTKEAFHGDLHFPRQLHRPGDPEHQGQPEAPRRGQEDAEGHGRRAEAVLPDDGQPRHRHGGRGPE